MKKIVIPLVAATLAFCLVGCDDTPSKNPQESETNTAQSEQAPAPEIVSDESPEENNITVENNADFAAILNKKSEIDPSYTEFADAYKNKIVEFDGCITYLANHGQYKTRYDLLLSSGDFVDEDTANPGPIFKFNDVSTHDLGIDDLYLPSFVKAGSNVHIIAEVEKYNANSGVFFLDPIKIEER